MALASLTRIKNRVVEILGANSSAYSGTVSGSMGAYPYDAEIADAILEADAMLVTEAYFQNPTLASRFETVSGELANGADLPEFIGKLGKVELKTAAATWQEGTEAQSKDDVVNLVRYGTAYLGAANIEGIYFRDGGSIYHTGAAARVSYPVYTKTSAVQSLDMHEQAVIAGALMLLYKPGSPLHSEPGSAFYGSFFQTQIQRVALNQDLQETPVMGGEG